MRSMVEGARGIKPKRSVKGRQDGIIPSPDLLSSEGKCIWRIA